MVVYYHVLYDVTHSNVRQKKRAIILTKDSIKVIYAVHICQLQTSLRIPAVSYSCWHFNIYEQEK